MKKARFLVIAALALLSSTAFAEENYVAEVNGVQYESFNDAVDNWTDGTTLKLLEDWPLTTTITIGTDDVAKNVTLDLNKKNVNQTTEGFFILKHGSFNITGEGKINSTNDYYACVKVTGSGSDDKAENYSVLTVDKDVTMSSQYYAAYISYDKKPVYHSYGAVINYNGKTEKPGGTLYVNGSVQDSTGVVPQVNIGNTAEIKSDEIALYAAGYAIWNISGAKLEAQTGIYVKAGTVNITDATIVADGEYAKPVADGNGANSTGDGIIMDSKKGYKGIMQLNISGNTTITSENGYAIHEALTDMDETSTIALVITDGTFTGDKGAVNYSEAFRQALIDGSSSKTWTLNGITGGNFSSNPLACADNYVAVESSTGGFTVKPATEAPQPGEKVYITSATTITDLTVPTNTEIIVQTGATYTVGQVLNVTADLSKVTVQPGGTLIAGSIVSDSTHQFVVESDLTYGTGVVKYDNVSTVESPKGTVQLALKAKQLSESSNLWQHFGIPTTEKPTLVKSIQVAFKEWDSMKGWVYDGGSSKLTAPFVGHEVSTVETEEGNVIGFNGSLVTNPDTEFELSAWGYNFLANSYTAPMSAKVLVNSYDDLLLDNVTDGAIWVYKPGDSQYSQYNKAILKNTDVDLASMQGFFIQNKTKNAESFTVDYTNAIYNKALPELNNAEVENSGAIKLSDGTESAMFYVFESDSYSDEFEAGYDAEQMETGMIQIYALSGSYKLASLATNSIDGKIIEIKTKANTTYTLTFSNLQNDGFSLTDISGEQEKEVEISEGGTCRFTAPANSTVQYFRLGEGTLDAEETEAAELNFWVNENTLYVAGAESDIVVYNAAGVKVAAAKANGNAIQTVNIAGLASGLYIVESGALTGKFIK